MNLLESQPTWEFKTGNSFNCLHKCEPQIHGKEHTYVLEGQWYIYAHSDSLQYTHHQWSYVRAPLCWGAPSKAANRNRFQDRELCSSLTALGPVGWTAPARVMYRLGSGVWLWVCVNWAPQGEAQQKPCQRALLMLTPTLRLPSEEMGWGCYLSPGNPSTGWKPMSPNGIG